MNLGTSVLIDNILFLITSLSIIVWVFRKKITFKEKLAYSLFFIIFNSSYNIMVKPIHDNNTIIFRTFIWRYKIGPLSIMDILFVILMGVLFFKIITNFFRNKFLNLIYLREIIFIIIGISSFIINKGYFLDSTRFLVECKGIIYFFVTIVLTLKYLNRSLDEIDYFKVFSFILIFSFISTLIFDRYYLWVRYGQVVKIIDQEDAYTISLLCIYFYGYKVIKKFKISTAIIFSFLVIQNLLCFYKMNFVYMIFSIFILVFFILLKTKKVYVMSIMATLFIITLFLTQLEVVKEIVYSDGIYTRIFQSLDFIKDMNERGIYSEMFGLGLGTPYKSTFDIGDGGEVKIIDQLYSGYRFAVQTPIIGVLKYVGIVGFIINSLFIISILYKIKITINPIKRFLSIEFVSLATLFIFNLIVGTTSFSTAGTLPSIIFNAFIIGRINQEIYNFKNGDYYNEDITNK